MSESPSLSKRSQQNTTRKHKHSLVYRQQTIFNSSVNPHTCRQLLSCSAHSLSGTYPHTASIPQCITLTNSYVTRLESYPASCFLGKWLHVGHMQSGELEWPENVGAGLLRAASWHPVTIQWRYAPCHPCDVLFLYILEKCGLYSLKNLNGANATRIYMIVEIWVLISSELLSLW